MKNFGKFVCAFLCCALITPYIALADDNMELHAYEDVIMMGDVLSEADTPLTENERNFCLAVVQGFTNRDAQIDVSDFNITRDEFVNNGGQGGIYRNLNSLIQTEHPELYYAIGPFNYFSSPNQIITMISPSYNMSVEETAAAQAEIDADIDKIKAHITDNMSDYEKVLAVHDYMVNNYCYDERVFEGNEDEVRTINRFVSEKTGVCEAYSLYFKYVMNRLGIDCETVPSDACRHMWNKVKVDSKWYNIDVTQDDPIIGLYNIPFTSIQPYHRYFLLTDSEIATIDNGDTNNHHNVWNEHDWAGGECLKSTDDALAQNPIRDITGVMAYKGEDAYYIDSIDVNLQGNNPTQNNIRKFSMTGENTIAYTYDNDNVWRPAPNSYFQAIFSNLIEFDGNIYFNTPSKVMKLDTEKGGATEVFDFEEKYPENKTPSKTYLYGLIVENDTLKAAYTSDITTMEDLTLLDVNLANPTPTAEPTAIPSTAPSTEPTTAPTPTPTPEPLDKPVIEPVTDEATGETRISVTTDIPEERKDEAVVYIAQYDENGVLLGIEPVIGGDVTTFPPKEGAATIKAYIWNKVYYPLSGCSVYDLLTPRL